MRGFKWKMGISLASLLLFLALMVWVPMSAADAHVGTTELATLGIAQATPTVDLTVTALAKEQLTLHVRQLQNQVQDQNNWFANNSTALIAAVATVIVALFGISQWAINRRDERRKEIATQEKESKDRQAEHDKDLRAQAEERFRAAITALGSDNEATQVGGAILLRSFLNPEDKKIYGRYYTQIFDLAVAYLRPSHASKPLEDPNTPVPSTLRQALIVVFKESYPLARSLNKGIPQSLDASGIQLDGAYFFKGDLEKLWAPEAYIRGANLNTANLREITLHRSNLERARLFGANLERAALRGANLRQADLRWVNCRWANFQSLYRGDDLFKTDFSDADLSYADFKDANLRGTNIESALFLKDAKLHGVTGLTKEQLETCKAKGAIVDEDTSIGQPTSPVPPSPPPQQSP